MKDELLSQICNHSPTIFPNPFHCVQKLQERCEHQARNISGLEERCTSLKTTIDQLNLTLERASSGETELRGEIQNLQRNLMDTSLNSQSNCDKLKQVGEDNVKIWNDVEL